MTKNYKKLLLLSLSLSVFATVFFSDIAPVHAITVEPLYKVLQTNENIRTIWTQVRNMVNVVIIAVLIFIAFANILRINLNNYAIKKFLPALVFGVILANFSYFICVVCVDLANVAMSLLMNGASGAANEQVGSGKIGVAGAFDFSSMKVDANNLGRSFVYILFEIVGAIFVFILSILFFVRNYIIYFLVSLSPLAFMATILPETKSVFKQWMSMFMKWTFMPIVSLFWLWLGGMWWASGFNPSSSGGSTAAAGGDFNSSLFGVVFGAICYYLALTTPFKMGGDIMSKWGGAAKKAWGATGGAAWNSTGGAAINAGKNGVKKWYDTKRKGVVNHIETKTKAGKWFANKRDGAELNNQIATMKLEKSRSDNFRSIALQRWVRDGDKLHISDRAAESRLKKIIGAGVADEASNPAYKNSYSADALMGKLRYYEDQNGDLRLAKAADMGDWRRLRKVGANGALEAVDEAEWSKDQGLTMFEEHAASFGELARRGKSNSHDDHDRVNNFLQAAGNPTGHAISTNIDGRVMAISAVEEATGALSSDGVAAARAVANGGSVPVTNISRESIEALAEVETSERETLTRDVEHDAAIADTINRRLRDADSLAGQQGRDGLTEAQSHLAQMKDQASLGLGKLQDTDPATRSASIAAAVDAAKAISGSFETSLKTREGDPEKMAEELGRIFTSTEKEIARLEASDLATEIDKYSQSANWKQERIQSDMQTVPQQAELRAVNSAFASAIQGLQGASVERLESELGKHIDMIVESNEGIKSAIESKPGNLDLSSLKADIGNQIKQSIVSSQTSNTSSTAADPTSKLRDSMVAALTDPNVNKRLAHTFQTASETALKSAPRPVIDIKAPSGPSTPPSRPTPPTQGGI